MAFGRKHLGLKSFGIEIGFVDLDRLNVAIFIVFVIEVLWHDGVPLKLRFFLLFSHSHVTLLLLEELTR
jgi:hypothetical protein